MIKRFSILFMMACLTLFAHAQDSTETTIDTSAANKALMEYIQKIMTDSVAGRSGKVEINEANGYINVPQGYMYLNKEQMNHLLVDYWGNTQDDEILGGLVVDTAAIYEQLETAFIVYYEDCGYIKDNDASDIDYDDVLEEIKEDIEWHNKELKEAGLNTCELIGWAETPYYDKDQKVLYWAKHVRFTDDEGESTDVLNYDMRVLGRKGMFMLTAVSDLDQLEAVKKMNATFVDNVMFNEGYTYDDFDASKDHIAEWTIGGLVAGNVLAKTGLLAKLGLMLAKFWKIIAVAVVAVIAGIKKFFGKSDDEPKKEDEGTQQNA